MPQLATTHYPLMIEGVASHIFRKSSKTNGGPAGIRTLDQAVMSRRL